MCVFGGDRGGGNTTADIDSGSLVRGVLQLLELPLLSATSQLKSHKTFGHVQNAGRRGVVQAQS